MVSEETKNCSDILFGYFNGPACGFFGMDDGGFSVDVYESGKVIYKTYIFDQTVKTETEYKISKDAVIAIRSLMEKYQTNIDSFDDNIDNGSCDGSANFFIFGGKRIITWNIEYYDENELKKKNPSYYKGYLSAIRQENQILLIFNAVTEILKSSGINLDLSKVRFK